jgi:hypothetical protein
LGQKSGQWPFIFGQWVVGDEKIAKIGQKKWPIGQIWKQKWPVKMRHIVAFRCVLLHILEFCDTFNSILEQLAIWPLFFLN